MTLIPPLRHLPMGLVWQMPVPVACSLAVEGAGIAATCGQCPLDDAGNVLDRGDAAAQARRTAQSTRAVIAHLSQARHPALAVLYHAADDPGDVTSAFAAAFPAAVLAPVRLPHFYFPGMRIEADVWLTDTPPRRRQVREGAAMVELAEGGVLTFARLTAPPDTDVAAVLAATGLPPERLLAAHWFADRPPPAPWLPCPDARVVPPPGEGTAATLILAPGRVVADRTPGGALRRRHGRFAWLCAVADGHDLAQAAGGAMDALALSVMPDLAPVKATTHYVGGPVAEDLYANLAVRHARFPRPGPASTGVPVAGLAGGLLSIDMLAVVDSAAA